MSDQISRRQPNVSAVLAVAACVVAALWLGYSKPAAAEDAHPSRADWKAKFVRTEAVPYPDDNPYSEAKANLGKALFFDPLLSGSQRQSCASCHNPSLSWTDRLKVGLGAGQMSFHTPSLLNIAWVPRPGWFGQFKDLEAVAFTPITKPVIMNLPEHELLKRLSAIPGYVDAFHAAFGDNNITRPRIEAAIATFERTIVSGDAPFDRWIKGDEAAIGEAAKRGFDLFNSKAACTGCHNGWALTDSSFHDIGSAKGKDIGRGQLFPNSLKLKYAFKTPTLRDVARRPPYLHDGTAKTLEEVIDLYDRGGIDRPSRSNLIHPLHLTAAEKKDLIAFLMTLNGDNPPVTVPNLPR